MRRGWDNLLIEEEIKALSGIFELVRSAVSRVIIGQDALLEGLLVCMVASGHALVEGPPGIGKTTMVKAVASCFDLEFKRIQFTPDLMPSDILGTKILDQRSGDFRFKEGPIFANMILADEINRATPKVQSALLECMQERQVTVDGESKHLPEPFIVLATLNPIEHEGTYPLPEAQLDRFLMKLLASYPDRSLERYIIQSYPLPDVEGKGIVKRDYLIQAQKLVHMVSVSDDAVDYIVSVAYSSRIHPDVRVGLSTRGALQLLLASKAKAMLEGNLEVSPEYVKSVAPSVMRHRILLKPESCLDVSVEDVIREILD